MNPNHSEQAAKVLTLHIDGNPLTELIETSIARMLTNLYIKTNSKEYVSQKELAQKIGLSIPTVIDLRKRGIIPGVNIGNKWRFEVSEVWESLKAHQQRQNERFSPIKRNGRP